MSDRPPLEAFLEWKLKIESPSLAYAVKAATRDVIFAVDIPYPLLKAWHDIITSQKKERAPNNAQNTDGGEDPSSSSSSCTQNQQFKNFSSVDLFEHSIPENGFAISQDQQIRGEMDQDLRISATKVHALYGKSKGGTKRKELNSKTKRFHIFEGQILSVKELIRDNYFIKDELAEWKKNSANLQEEKEKLYQEMLLAVQKREQKINDLQQENKELLS